MKRPEVLRAVVESLIDKHHEGYINLSRWVEMMHLAQCVYPDIRLTAEQNKFGAEIFATGARAEVFTHPELRDLDVMPAAALSALEHHIEKLVELDLWAELWSYVEEIYPDVKFNGNGLVVPDDISKSVQYVAVTYINGSRPVYVRFGVTRALTAVAWGIQDPDVAYVTVSAKVENI